MNILCLKTIDEQIVFALQKGEESDFYISLKGCNQHNFKLLPLMEAFLKKNKLQISDIDVFGVVVGPGSFTGIRLGVATINALAFALDKKIVAITTLELPSVQTDDMVLLDCKHDNYYCGTFDGKTMQYSVTSKKNLENLPNNKIFMNGFYEKELLQRCLEKVENSEYCFKAMPFYLKKSSAEIETGIEC